MIVRTQMNVYCPQAFVIQDKVAVWTLYPHSLVCATLATLANDVRLTLMNVKELLAMVVDSVWI